MDSSAPKVDWKVLATEGVECQHISFYQLQRGMGDTLSAIAAKHKKSHTVAVILGNVDSGLELAPEFSEGLGKPKKGAMPMILVGAEDAAGVREF